MQKCFFSKESLIIKRKNTIIKKRVSWCEDLGLCLAIKTKWSAVRVKLQQDKCLQENNIASKDKISELLNIPENEVPVIMITMGKVDKSSSKIRGYRKPADEFVKFY